MPFSSSSKRVLVILALLLLVPPLLVSFLAQTPEPSPSPSGSPSPSPSPSPSRTPSPTPLPGAQNFHQWGSVTVFNGLPSDSVRAIAQTPDGVMWFGTDNGLARFDGRRIQTMQLGGAEVDRVLALKTSSTGELWIGTSSGAFVYTENRFQPIEGTVEMGITTLLAAKDVYLATDNGLVLRIVRDDGPLRVHQLIPAAITDNDGNPLAITSLVEAGGKLLAATSGSGIFSIMDGTVNMVHTPPTPGTINSVAVTDGAMWLGTDATKDASGIYRSIGGPRFERIAAPTAKVLTLETNDSGLWVGTERYGLFHIIGSKLNKSYTFANTSGGLRSDNIFTLFTDREGVLWIGTNRGASRFDRQGSFQQTVSDIPNSNFIRSLFFASKESILAGSNRGLFRWDGKDWKPQSAFGTRTIYALAEHRKGELMIGTATGLCDISGRQVSGGDFRGFANLDRTTYAAVYGRGVVRISPGAIDQGALVYGDESVTSIAAGSGQIWIGTAGNGLVRFSGETATLAIGPDVLKSGTIWKMFEAGDGVLWIAGQHGVWQLRDGQPEEIVKVEDVRDVLVKGPELWAATTTRGLLHARRDERFGWLVTTIGFEQGLPSEKAFSVVPSDEGLLVGTNRGVVTYRPGTIAPKLIPVRILSQRVHDLSEARSTIPLEYPQSSLLVEVAGQSSRTFPEEFQYAFVLKKANGDVVDSRVSNDSQYAPAELGPGDYTIESIAFNRDLLASEPLTISFSVAKAPFPWTATALAVLLLLALVGLAWAIIEHRRIVQRNRELAAARLDLANEAERERRRIARDLHDQTLADLRNLMMTTDKMPAAGTAVRQEIESISTDIRRICEDLSPSVLENVGLVAALESLLSRTIENSRFVAAESVEERIAFPLNMQLQIYRIAQEVLTNIQRHSTATQVEMSVEITDEFVLTIRDDGSVFHPDGSAKRGRGISNIRARANLVNGRVAWKESRRGGNVFSLKVGGGNGST